MYLDIILLVVIAYLNAARAKRKGYSAFLWGLITIVAFFVCTFIGEMIVLVLFYKGPIAVEALQSFFMNNILSLVFCLVAGFGGFLTIRYVIDRLQDKAAPK